MHPFLSNSYLQMLLNLLQMPLPDMRQYRADLPETLNAVLQQATAKRPAERYATPRLFVEAFRQAAGIATESE